MQRIYWAYVYSAYPTGDPGCQHGLVSWCCVMCRKYVDWCSKSPPHKGQITSMLPRIPTSGRRVSCLVYWIWASFQVRKWSGRCLKLFCVEWCVKPSLGFGELVREKFEINLAVRIYLLEICECVGVQGLPQGFYPLSDMALWLWHRLPHST